MVAMARLTLILLIALAMPLAAQQQDSLQALGEKRFHAIEGIVVGIVAMEVAAHGFGRMNALADGLEDGLPHALHYNHAGDPATWLQHTAWAAGMVAAGALVAKAVGAGGRHGARDTARAVFVYYLARELADALADRSACHTAWHNRCEQPSFRHPGHSVHVGWAVDGLGDLLGPGTLMVTLGR